MGFRWKERTVCHYPWIIREQKRTLLVAFRQQILFVGSISIHRVFALLWRTVVGITERWFSWLTFCIQWFAFVSIAWKLWTMNISVKEKDYPSWTLNRLHTLPICSTNDTNWSYYVECLILNAAGITAVYNEWLRIHSILNKSLCIYIL